MNGKRMAGAVVGGLIAGPGLTAMLILQEQKTGKPPELTELRRASAARLGQETP